MGVRIPPGAQRKTPVNIMHWPRFWYGWVGKGLCSSYRDEVVVEEGLVWECAGCLFILCAMMWMGAPYLLSMMFKVCGLTALDNNSSRTKDHAYRICCPNSCGGWAIPTYNTLDKHGFRFDPTHIPWNLIPLHPNTMLRTCAVLKAARCGFGLHVF